MMTVPSDASAAAAAAASGSATSGSPLAAWLRVAFWRKPRHLLRDDGGGHHPHRRSPSSNSATTSSTSSSSDSMRTASEHDAAPAGEMQRTLGLFDLVMIGIGGTVGSGVFATAGLIARAYAGPAAVLSWLVAGAGCVLSGFSFMELACLLPSTGSTYAYAYHALGELPAMAAGFLLSLEYGVSSAGGARSWSDKFTNWMETELQMRGPAWMKPEGSTVDLYAGLLMATCVAIVLCGMQAGKLFVNVVTMTKISVVLFIIVVGLSQFDAENITPLVPPASTSAVTGHVEFGWPGVFLGASASFFGYIGYDEVCCLAGEAKNPTRNIPRAVIGTIVGAALLSTLATFSLVGMQRYTSIDTGESFGKAFEHVGLPWAATIVTTGEVFTMPITTFIGFLAQPRVQYAMAKDGLLPSVFARVDENGNLFHGTLLCGIAITTIAVFVPFRILWNFISLGILVAFNLTNASLLLVRAGQLQERAGGSNASFHNAHGALIGGFLVTSFFAAFHWQKSVIAFVPIPADASAIPLLDVYMDTLGAPVAAFFTAVAVGIMCMIKYIEVVTSAESSDLDTAHSGHSRDGKRKSSDAGIGRKEIVLTDTAAELTKLKKRLDDEHPGNNLRARTLSSEGDDEDHENHLEAGQSKTKAVGGESRRLDALSPIDLMSDNESEADVTSEAASGDDDEGDDDRMMFRAPLVPFAPCVAIFFNWFLFAQMDASSVLLIALWLLLALAVYVGYSRHHSLAHQETLYHRVDVQS